MLGKIIYISDNEAHIELNENTGKMYGDSFYNTKTGGNPTDSYVTMSGNIYLRSFILYALVRAG